MNCVECNGIIHEVTGTYIFNSNTLGEVAVPNITFQECHGCGDRLVSYENALILHEYIKEKEQEEINKFPAGDLITAGEAAELLGVTKQAFSKNPKIKRGFIYHLIKGNRRLYFKKSVQLFKENGDGRFPIAP